MYQLKYKASQSEYGMSDYPKLSATFETYMEKEPILITINPFGQIIGFGEYYYQAG
jgi:hypothetical protein